LDKELEAQLLAKWPTLRPCYLALQSNCQQVAPEEGRTHEGGGTHEVGREVEGRGE